MGIENLLEKLNANLEQLIKVIGDVSYATANAPAEDPEPAEAPAKKKVTKKTTKKAPAKKKAPQKKGINYDRDVKPQVLLAIATPEGREEVKDLLAEYEAKKATEIKPEDYPDFLKAIEAIIEKYEDE